MANEIQIDILAHADFSGQIKQTKRCPGYAAFASLVERVRRENPSGTLFLDAGDGFCANFWGGRPSVRAVSLLGTDAMTLGNHEFDRGQAFLEDCIAAADFPLLSANIRARADGALVRGVQPWVMLERCGVKIGVLGLTTEYTPHMVTAASFAPYEADSCADAAKYHIPLIRAAGADVVVVLAHIPFYVDDAHAISGELSELLEQIPAVDVCIGGHIPGDFAGVVNGTAVLKGGFSGVSLTHARLLLDPVTKKIVGRECSVLHTDRTAETLPVYEEYANRVTAPYADFFETPLTTTDETWRIRLSAETRLGNFLAGCVREAAGTDAAYMNATSAGGTIQPGTVTKEDIVSVMGFNDPILMAQISGAALWRLFELVYVPERFGNNAGLMFAGLIVHADHTQPAFHKIRALTLQDGTPVEKERIYTVATSEYMASGGNDTGEIANALDWHETGVRVHDAIFVSIQRHGCLYVSPEQRMHEIGRPENDNSPF